MASQPKLDSAASAQISAAKIAAQSVVEAHSELYHYTGTAGLKGIIESNSFRATYFADMNDAQEIHALRVQLVDELKKRLETAALSRCLCGRRRRADCFLLRGVLLLACGR
jgi:hypothetical protein